MLDAIQLAQDALRRAQAEHAGQSSAAASMEQIAAGVSAIVNAVKAAAEQGAAEKAAMADMVRQIGTGLADVVGLLEAHAERPDDHAARAQTLGDAIGAAVAGLKLPAPKVQVDVQPAAVSLPAPKVEVTVQPAPVTIQSAAQAGQQWRIEIERAGKNPAAPIAALIVTRL